MNPPVTSSQLDASFRHCVKLAKQSGSNFYFAFLSLPRAMFRDMCALYAFMRVTDDIGDDESQSLTDRQAELERWKTSLNEALVGEPSGQIFPALNDVVQRHQIPSEYLHAVISGVESDLTPREFRTFMELEQYCYQVAGAVGLCCLKIWGCQDTEENRQRGIACGTAFQLINILRDLKEDTLRGRLYLPLDELEESSLIGADLSKRQQSVEYRNFMKSQVERAWNYFQEATPLLSELPPPGERILSAMFEIYGTLLTEIEAANYDVFSKRIELSRSHKMLVSLRCLLRMGANIPKQPTSFT